MEDDGARKGSKGRLARQGSAIDEDEDGYGIGNKIGKGLAALKARGESLSRQNTQEDLAADLDNAGLNDDISSRKLSQKDGEKRKKSRKNTFSQPVISDKGDGTHEVSYVPPPVGDPYEVYLSGILRLIR